MATGAGGTKAADQRGEPNASCRESPAADVIKNSLAVASPPITIGNTRKRAPDQGSPVIRAFNERSGPAGRCVFSRRNDKWPG
jgi:hypothetical protein